MPRLGLLLGLCFATGAAGRAAEGPVTAINQVDASAAGGMAPGGKRLDIGACCGPYRIQSFVKMAAALQALPEKERIAQLRVWAAYRTRSTRIWPGNTLHEQVIYLCRLLFERRGGGSLPWPDLGYPRFVGSDSATMTDRGGRAVYPDEPFLFVGDVPFLVGRDYIFTDESVNRYLEMCLKDGQWTHRRYDQVTPDVVANALHALLEKYAWRRALGPWEREVLMEQALPYEAPELWSAVEGFNGTRMQVAWMKKRDSEDAADLSLRDVVDLLAVAVWGGTRPYRYVIRLESGRHEQEIGAGRGRADLPDPFAWEEFHLPWKDVQPGQVIVFEATDAKGTRLVQRIRVTGPKSAEADWPAVTPPAKAE